MGRTEEEKDARIIELEDEIGKWKDASGLVDGSGDPDGVTPALMNEFYAANGDSRASALETKCAALEVKLEQLRSACDAHVNHCPTCYCDINEAMAPAAVEKQATHPAAASVVFYDAQESETLSYDDPGEAIEALVDGAWDGKLSKAENARKHCPIEVKAYARDTLGESEVEHLVSKALEDLNERFGEEYGDPDGDHDAWNHSEWMAIRARLSVAYRYATDRATVWRCHVVETKNYSFEEAVAELIERGYLEAGEVGTDGEFVDLNDWATCDVHETTYPIGGKCNRCEGRCSNCSNRGWFANEEGEEVLCMCPIGRARKLGSL